MPGYDHLALGIDVTGTERSAESVRKLNEVMKQGAEIAIWAGKQTVAGLGEVERAFAGATRESAAFLAHHPLIIAGITKVGMVAVEHAGHIDQLANSWRALRLAMSPTAFTATTIGAGVLLEAALKNAEQVARENREISMVAAQSGSTFQDVLRGRTVDKIEGAGVSGVFAGKGVAQIRALVEEYGRLADPVTKAAFAVEHFGANAEKAMPLLRVGLAESMEAADKLAASVTDLDRESLERLSVTMDAIPRKAHEIAAAFRSWWETETLGKRWFAMLAAHVADTIGVGEAPSAALVLGQDKAFQMPSFASVAKQKADAEWFISAVSKMQSVDSGTLKSSDAAMAAYDSSREGIQGRLTSAEARRLKYRDQAKLARGTDLEQSVLTSYLQAGQEVAGYRADIAAIEAKEKAVRDLEAAMKSLASSMEAFNAFDSGGATTGQSRGARLKFLTDPFGMFGQGYGLEEALKLEKALRESMAGFNLFEAGGTTNVQSSADRSRGLVNPFGMLGQGFGLAGRLKSEQSDRDAAVRSLRTEADFTMRIMELRSGPGGEVAAAGQAWAIREKALRDELEITEDINRYREDGRRNDLEYQVKIAELQKHRSDELRNTGGQVFDALFGGGAGVSQFAKNFLMGQGRTLAGNAFAELFKNTSGNLGLGGKVFQGTIFGQDPLKGATDMNTMATVENTRAMMSFASVVAGGAGGGFSSAASTFGRMAGVGVEGVPESTGIYGGTNGDWAGETNHPAGSFSWGRALGIGGAAVGGGIGIYAGIRSGGAGGALAASGSALAMAGTILALSSKALSIAGPIGALAGMGLGAITSFLPNPKEQRARELDRDRMSRAYTMPSGVDYSVDIYGHSSDYDYRGTPRSVTNVYISAMDTQSFSDAVSRNPDAIVTTVAGEIHRGNAEVFVGHLQRRLGL